MYYCLSQYCLEKAGLRPANTTGVPKDSKSSKCPDCSHEMRLGKRISLRASFTKKKESTVRP